MSFRRGPTFNSPEHYVNSLAFARSQRNAAFAFEQMRGKGSSRADEQLLRAERVFLVLPDRVSRNLAKQLLRRSLTRLRKMYQNNWRSHGATHRSYGAQMSLRKAASSVIQSNADTRGDRTTARAGMRYKRKPRSYIAPIVDSKPGWGIRKATQDQFPPRVALEDLAIVIEQQFDDLVRKARLKARKS
jgi:hypothetical protein